MTLGNARSEDFSNAVQSLIDTLTGSDATTADDVTPNELSSLQSALAALPLSSAPPQGLPDDAGYDSGSGLLDGRPGLWEQLLDVAGELDEEDGEMYRGEVSVLEATGGDVLPSFAAPRNRTADVSPLPPICAISLA